MFKSPVTRVPFVSKFPQHELGAGKSTWLLEQKRLVLFLTNSLGFSLWREEEGLGKLFGEHTHLTKIEQEKNSFPSSRNGLNVQREIVRMED